MLYTPTLFFLLVPTLFILTKFWIDREISKESLQHWILSEAYSELRKISKMNCFVKIIHGVKELTIFAKTIHLRYLAVFWIRLWHFSPECKCIDYYDHSLSIFTKLWYYQTDSINSIFSTTMLKSARGSGGQMLWRADSTACKVLKRTL